MSFYIPFQLFIRFKPLINKDIRDYKMSIIQNLVKYTVRFQINIHNTIGFLKFSRFYIEKQQIDWMIYERNSFNKILIS